MNGVVKSTASSLSEVMVRSVIAKSAFCLKEAMMRKYFYFILKVFAIKAYFLLADCWYRSADLVFS